MNKQAWNLENGERYTRVTEDIEAKYCETIASLELELADLRAEVELLKSQHERELDAIRRERDRAIEKHEKATKRIAEAVVSCPSCGRHDFGLLSGQIEKLTRSWRRKAGCGEVEK